MSLPSISGLPARSFARKFEFAFARLQVAVLDACAQEAEWPARVATAIRVSLRFGAADPAAARSLTVDALAQGDEDARRRQRAVKYFAELLHAAVPEDAQRPEIAEQLLVGAIFSLAATPASPGR